MARPHRVEYAGARYHVFNRGNYRAPIFQEEGAKQAFMTCLWEACRKMGWRVHAYVLMKNHFHLALETPSPNLIRGMQWLLGTFSGRYNRFRKEQGHVFQGRFRAKHIGSTASLAAVVHYIHLNPVRAGLIAIEGAPAFLFSSLWDLHNPSARNDSLDFGTWLEFHSFTDDSDGRTQYGQHLALIASSTLEQRKMGFKSMCRGWASKEHGFRQGLVRRAEKKPKLEHPLQARAADWSCKLEDLLVRLGKTQGDCAKEIKSAPWKVSAAAEMRATTSATNAWLARELFMGAPASVSHWVCKRKKGSKLESR
jgi:putative transposase